MLTQSEADALFAMPKKSRSNGSYTFPLDFLAPYNGIEIPCPHLHIYVEGFAHRWAIPAPDELANSNNNLYIILGNFLKYCNVQETPDIKRGLFL